MKSKTSALALIKLPRAETPLFDRWLKVYRPALLDKDKVASAICPLLITCAWCRKTKDSCS